MRTLLRSSLLLLLPGSPHGIRLHHQAVHSARHVATPAAAMSAEDSAPAVAETAPADIASSPDWDGAILTCAKCKAAYAIDVADFRTGRQVHCSNCDHKWFQTPERLQQLPENMKLIDYPESMR